MAIIRLFQKGKEFKHTYSTNISKLLQEEGWIPIAIVTGYNASISWSGKQK